MPDSFQAAVQAGAMALEHRAFLGTSAETWHEYCTAHAQAVLQAAVSSGHLIPADVCNARQEALEAEVERLRCDSTPRGHVVRCVLPTDHRGFHHTDDSKPRWLMWGDRDEIPTMVGLPSRSEATGG